MCMKNKSSVHVFVVDQFTGVHVVVDQFREVIGCGSVSWSCRCARGRETV